MNNQLTKNKKILITGAKGMLGSTLQEVIASSGIEVIGLGSDSLDITDKLAIHNALKLYRPTHVANCAAYTAVDKAEKEITKSELINGIAPGFLAKECKSLGIEFLHVSTDYVFGNNSSEGYVEEDIPVDNQLN